MVAAEQQWCNGSPWLSWETIGPPPKPLPAGYFYYLPEQHHFVDRADVALNQVARVTARFLARWADEYAVYAIYGPYEARRQGVIPSDPQQRNDLLDELCDWLEREVVVHYGAINLSRHTLPLLEQSDGIPGYLVLAPTEFEALQQMWESAGLPRTLYYEAGAQRTHVVSAVMAGDTDNAVQRESPLRWAVYQSRSIAMQPEPQSEPALASAQVTFAQACTQFRAALSRRIAELEEPGCQRASLPGIKLPILLGAVVKASIRSREALESGKSTVTAIPSDERETDATPPVVLFPRPGPPQHLLPLGYHDYLPEYERFQRRQRRQTVVTNQANAVTVSTVARWADHFEAYLNAPQAMQAELRLDAHDPWRREGPLPQQPDEREQIIRQALQWLSSTKAPMWARIVNLYADGTLLLNQNDGAPGLLTLTNDQFSHLQAIWMQSGLPTDLYYRDREQRAVVEPVIYEGVVVRYYQRYSPLAWKRRDLHAIAAMPAPSLSQRSHAFALACETFAQAIRRHMADVATMKQLEPVAASALLGNLERLLERIEIVLSHVA